MIRHPHVCTLNQVLESQGHMKRVTKEKQLSWLSRMLHLSPSNTSEAHLHLNSKVPDPAHIWDHLHAALGEPGCRGEIQVQLLREGRGHGGEVQPGWGVRDGARPERPPAGFQRELPREDDGDRSAGENRGMCSTPLEMKWKIGKSE